MKKYRRTTAFGSARHVALLLSVAFFVTAAASADTACLLTPLQLHELTGRTFKEGEVSKSLGDGSPLCHYSEAGKPQRKLTIGVSTSNAARQFESRMRLLQMGNKKIELQGIGERAYFNGTAAGALSGDTLITITNLRSASDPQIAHEKVVSLLSLALEASRK